jgi:hypothetical protein
VVRPTNIGSGLYGLSDEQLTSKRGCRGKGPPVDFKGIVLRLFNCWFGSSYKSAKIKETFRYQLNRRVPILFDRLNFSESTKHFIVSFNLVWSLSIGTSCGAQ